MALVEQPKRPWLTRNLVVLSWVSLLQDTALELLYPILPIFLTSVLGAPVAVVGLTEGRADGVASLTKVVSGRVADRRDRRGLVGLGYGLAAAAKVVIAVATVWPVVLVGRVLDRFGKGVRGAARAALIADGTAPEHRGRAFGFHRSMDTAGAVIGPLIGLGLYVALGHRFRPLLILAAVPAVLSVVLVALVREPRRPVGDDPAPASSGPLPVAYRRVVAVLTVFAVVNFSDALLLLRAKQLGLGVSGVILAYCSYNLTYALGSYPAGAASDRLPRRFVFARPRRLRRRLRRSRRGDDLGGGVGPVPSLRRLCRLHRRREQGVDRRLGPRRRPGPGPRPPAGTRRCRHDRGRRVGRVVVA